nr:DegT/DnrJ/EryC1/StrS family aminotransferase [Stappia sp. MMSF_3263]
MTSTPPLPARFDQKTLDLIESVLNSNHLFYRRFDGTKSFADEAIEAFRNHLDIDYVATTSSGTASIHTALASLEIDAGMEVVVPPITDVGGLMPVIFQNLIPVFADVDRDSGMVTAETIQAALTEHTKAVIVMHHSGTPVDLDPILALCNEKNIPVIEDAAQALGATYKGKPCGTLGTLGAFSLNHWKHVTAGEGGFVATRDRALFEKCHHFADKYWDRLNSLDSGKNVKNHRIGLNYRLNELESALALDQLPRLADLVAHRKAAGDALRYLLAGLPGVVPQSDPQDSSSSYFLFTFRLADYATREAVIESLLLDASGRWDASRGYQNLLHRYPVVQQKAFFPGGVWPAEVVSGRKYDYNNIQLPNAEFYHDTSICMTLHQGFTHEHVKEIAGRVESALP